MVLWLMPFLGGGFFLAISYFFLLHNNGDAYNLLTNHVV